MFNIETELKGVFENDADPRIVFFAHRLSRSADCESILKLRRFALEGSEFSDRKICLGEHMIKRPAYQPDRGHEIPARIEHDTSLIIQAVIAKDGRRVSLCYSPLLNKYGQALHGITHATGFVIAVLAVFLSLANLAKKADFENNAIVQSKIDDGTCILVPKGCQSLPPAGSGNYFDCYLPQQDCQYGSRYGWLVFSTILIGLLGGLMTLNKERGKKFSELVGLEFNNPDYDQLLNHLCKTEGIASLDWSSMLKVNESYCTLRMLMLTLLSSFNDRLYGKIFTELLPGLAKGLKLSLVDEGCVINIEFLTQVVSRDPASTTPIATALAAEDESASGGHTGRSSARPRHSVGLHPSE
ncbi:MAG: hypothetical protein K0S29_1156 [Gammaproteobacteria bacterium]|jgi:hypothetical protein|nr:hypothetical protein [Gammaproteobacteria bacterium]